MQSLGVFRAGFGILACLLLADAAAPPAQAQVFSAPVNISPNLPQSRGPQLAVDGQGNVYVVWSDCGIGNCDVFFSGSTDGGANFSTPTNLSANPGRSFAPQIAVDGQGNINVVWFDDTPGNFDILFTRSTDGGVNFSAPLNLSANPGGSFNSQLALDAQGNINVVWNDFTPGNFDILFTRSTDGGVNFSAPLNLSANPGGSSVPHIAVDGEGNINVVWDDGTRDLSNIDILFSRSTDEGVNFSAPLNLSTNPGFSFEPQIAVDGEGNINVVWNTGFGLFGLESIDIFFSRSTDEGVNFSAPLNLSANPGSAGFPFRRPQITVDGQGNINAVWVDLTSGNFDILFTRSTDGVVFSTSLNLSANPSFSRRPQIAVDGQRNINVVWADLTSGNFDILFTRSTDGVAFSTPLNLSANPGFSARPQIAIDAQGNIYVVWNDTTPGKFAIFFRRSLDGLFQELIKTVFDINLKQGIANSLDAKLDLALRALEDMNENNNVAAIDALHAFMNSVDPQRGIQISAADADALIAAAQEIIALLGG